jgi:hypothetical protein
MYVIEITPSRLLKDERPVTGRTGVFDIYGVHAAQQRLVFQFMRRARIFLACSPHP